VLPLVPATGIFEARGAERILPQQTGFARQLGALDRAHDSRDGAFSAATCRVHGEPTQCGGKPKKGELRMEKSPLAIYQDHLARGELAYQYSPEAGRAVFYPRVICPFTGRDRLEWRVSAGLGTVYATTVTHPPQGEPYNVALIDCDEGFRLMSRVEGIDPMAVRIGMRVRFRMHEPDGDEPPYPVFVPAEAGT
jgi:uncharacterized OB-fold protein